MVYYLWVKVHVRALPIFMNSVLEVMQYNRSFLYYAQLYDNIRNGIQAY